MAGTVKVNHVQLGDSTTLTNNFVLQTNANGTAKLSRGEVGATTQDILTIDANGKVAFPQSIVAFRVYAASAVTALSAATAKINFDTKTSGDMSAFDITGAFDLATDRFQPTVAGYYSVAGGFCAETVSANIDASVRKNGNVFVVGNAAVASRAYVTALVYLNGVSDYIELFGYSSANQNTLLGSVQTYFSGILVAKV